MGKDVYSLQLTEVKRNIRFFGPRKGKRYWRFGMGARWELKRDGSRRLLGWSFFVGPYRLIFGRRNLIVDFKNF